MKIEQFPNPKLNLPKELRDSKEENVISNFQTMERYLSSVEKYIYTNINIDYLAGISLSSLFSYLYLKK